MMGKKILFIKEIQLNHSILNNSGSKYHRNSVVDNNHNIEKTLSNKIFWLEILKVLSS